MCVCKKNLPVGGCNIFTLYHKSLCQKIITDIEKDSIIHGRHFNGIIKTKYFILISSVKCNVYPFMYRTAKPKITPPFILA